MEEFLQSLISSGPTGIICAAIVYIIISIQRGKTSVKRDEDTRLIQYRVEKLETGHDSLLEALKELQDSIVSLQLTINELVMEVKYLKEKK
jgi:hypothetical protein